MKLSKKLTKKKIIIVSVVAVILIGGGLYLGLKSSPQKESTSEPDWSSINYVPRQEYKISKNPEGEVVEYQKGGLSFRMPLGWIEGWTEKSPVVKKGDEVVFYSPDAIVNPKNQYFLSAGCKISNGVLSVKTDMNGLKERLNGGTEVVIGGHEALKKIISSSKANFHETDVFVPMQRNLYSFILVSAYEDKDKCEEVFNDFLETVSIKR